MDGLRKLMKIKGYLFLLVPFHQPAHALYLQSVRSYAPDEVRISSFYFFNQHLQGILTGDTIYLYSNILAKHSAHNYNSNILAKHSAHNYNSNILAKHSAHITVIY